MLLTSSAYQATAGLRAACLQRTSSTNHADVQWRGLFDPASPRGFLDPTVFAS
ncbi:MAG: hypothetical protein GX596_13595 [Propionibacterium sp.]|nr:hypothetical protein [Propionibacterium sp.]